MWSSLLQTQAPVGVALLALVAAVLGSEPIPPALQVMADTERAFARLGYETNYRDAFLQYFAEEAVSFNPDPGPARPRLQALPAPPAAMKLKWEPRLGDVSAAGDLGYLTGPVETIVTGQPVRHSNYFSVWKRQPDGAYRVILDVGTRLPGPAAFAPGFVRAAARASWVGSDPKSAADSSLLQADEALASALRTRGAGDAYRGALHAAARLHRGGVEPATTREAGVEWLRANIAGMTAQPMKAETALSSDLGYTWGAWAATLAGGGETKGYYVRVWTRDTGGRWLVAVDVAEVSRP